MLMRIAQGRAGSRPYRVEPRAIAPAISKEGDHKTEISETC